MSSSVSGRPDWPRHHRAWDRAFRRGGLWYGLILFCVAGLFLIWPELDLLVAGIYYDPAFGDTGFPAGYSEFWLGVHDAIRSLGTTIGATLLIVLAVHLWKRRPMRHRNGRVLSYLLLALILGPVIIVNVVLKDNWGRARPYQIEDFGRDKAFSPALAIADQCKRNCSFVSGDVAIAFYLSAFGFVARRRRVRRRIFIGVLAFGVAVCWFRIFLGAHFFSDVIFSALFTLGVNAWLYHVIVHKRWEPARRTWGHLRAAWAALLSGSWASRAALRRPGRGPDGDPR